MTGMQPAQVIDLARSRPWGRQAWAKDLLERLPQQLAGAVQRWDLTIEDAYPDGAGLPVLAVRTGDLPAVLTFDGVGRDQAQQARILGVADGHGFVRLLDHAPELGAALLERLGAPLAHEVGDPVAQTDQLCTLLEQAWQLPLEVGVATAPDHKALGLLGIVEAGLADPPTADAHGAVLARAAGIAQELALSPQAQQVVVHGDPHTLNALRRPDGRAGSEQFAFIDPDGFRCEREYDAGVVLRDLAGPLTHLERTEGVGAGRRWHAELVARVARRLDLDADRVAAWAFLERVTTGVHLGRLGYTEESRSWLALAHRM